MEGDWRQNFFPRIANIDRRLVMSHFALSKLRTQIPPMTRTLGLAIVPIVFGMLFLRATTYDQDKREADDSSNAGFSHL